jgi:hypothetical protein
MKARTQNHVALGLTLASAAAFAAFHFLPLAAGIGKPLEVIPHCMAADVWRDTWYWIKHPDDLLEDPILMAFLPGFFLVALGFAGAPFCVSLLSRSRVLWWAWLVIWFLASVAVVYEMIATYQSIVADYNGAVVMGPGLFCLFLGLQLQLVALFFVRRGTPEVADNRGPA